MISSPARHAILILLCTGLSGFFSVLLMSGAWILADVCAVLGVLVGLDYYFRFEGIRPRPSWHLVITLLCLLTCLAVPVIHHLV